MRVASWNVNSLRARVDHVLRWLGDAAPDVLCLQETKLTDDLFPADALRALGYAHQCVHGQKTYNGVAIVSKLPLEDVRPGFTVGAPDEQCRLLQATVDGVRILDCYVPNGSFVGSPKFAYKLDWLRRLRAELDARTPGEPLLVCGDMNVALTDLDVWDPFECEGKLLFHPVERDALQSVLAWGLTDAYRALHPNGTAFSWWDYRAGAWPRNHGFRIDHVFLSAPLLARCTDVTIHRDVRGWDKPSDHVPVVVTI